MFEKRYLLGASSIVLLGMAAASGGWIGSKRPVAPELQADRTIVVISSRDSGAGTLRDAIFAAARARHRVRILLKPSRIELQTPLPPLVNAHGVVIDAEQSRSRIDARGLTGAPVLDLAAPNSVIAGLAIDHAAEQAILIRSSAARLRNLTISDCAEGVHLADGARDLLIEESRFVGNGIGVTIPGNSTPVRIHQSHFSNHDQAGIWAVADRALDRVGATVSIRGNTFRANRIGVVAIHVPVRVERNQFERERDSAIYLMGRSSLIRGNRIREGAGVGIFADQTEAAMLEANEVDHNAAVGLVLRSARNTVAKQNRVYANGYGMAVVFGDAASTNLLADNLVTSQSYDGFYIVGGSPFLRDNVVARNRQAALRVLDFVPRVGPAVGSAPLLKGNRFEANLLNDPIRGLYRVADEEVKR